MREIALCNFFKALESPCLRKSLRGHDVYSITNTSTGGADNVGTGNCEVYISPCAEMCISQRLLIYEWRHGASLSHQLWNNRVTNWFLVVNRHITHGKKWCLRQTELWVECSRHWTHAGDELRYRVHKGLSSSVVCLTWWALRNLW